MGCCFSVDSHPAANTKEPRKATDVFWIVFFVLVWFLLACASLYSYANNHPTRFLHGADSFGNICGKRNKHIDDVAWSGLNMKDRPYVFHLNMKNTSFGMKICVAKCAAHKLSAQSEVRDFRNMSKLVRYDFNFEQRSDPNIEQDNIRGFGPFPALPVPAQRPILNRCTPQDKVAFGPNTNLINKAYNSAKDSNILEKVLDDLYKTSSLISLLIAFALILSLLVAFTIHYFAAFVSSLILIITSLLFTGLTIYSWVAYTGTNQIVIEDQVVDKETLLYFALLSTAVTFVVLCIAYFMKSRIQIMGALFDETSSCLRSIPGLLFQPIWTTVVMLLFIAFWLIVFLGLATAQMNVISKDNKTQGFDTRFRFHAPAKNLIIDDNGDFTAGNIDVDFVSGVKHKQYPLYFWLVIVHMVMLFWTSEFILGCQQMTVASSVASWYFTRDRDNLESPICASIFRIMSYHLGTIAFGSFLMLIKLLFLIPLFLHAQLGKYKDRFAFIGCLFSIVECFLYLVKKFLDYISASAYTITAIEGSSFCKSAKTALRTLGTNPVRIATFNTLGSFIILLGKLIVTVSVTIVSFYLFRKDQGLNHFATPIVFATFCAFLVAHSMLTIYSMAISVIFLCYSEDVDINSRTGEGLYAPGGLLKLAQEDLKELTSGQLMISRETNKNQAPPTPKDVPIEMGRQSNINEEPKVGFIY